MPRYVSANLTARYKGAGVVARYKGADAAWPYAAAALWTPAQFGADLKCWRTAKDTTGMTLNAGNVSAWANKGSVAGNATQATASAQPLYSATGWDGARPAVVGAQGVWLTIPAGEMMVGSQPFYVFVVAGSLGGSNNQILIGAPLIDGPAGALQHVEASYHHRVRRMLEAKYGAPITYKNLGIGGTTAGTGGSGTPSDRYQGSDPIRLASILAAKGAAGATVCSIAFATNEDDNENLINNITAIASYCVQNGIIPIVVGQPRVWTRTIARMKRNDMRVMRGGLSRGAAVIPLALGALEYADCIGIFPSLYAQAGGVNHPGPFEHRQYGRWFYDLAFGGA